MKRGPLEYLKMAAELTGAETTHGAKFRLWETALNVKADPMETSEFFVAAKECIEEGDACEVIELMTNEEFQELTKYIGWEMIAIVFPYLEQDHLKKDCYRILDIICQVCSPKEVLLGLREQLHETSSLESFVACLKFVQKALMCLAQRRSKFIKMACEDVSKQFARFTQKALSSMKNNRTSTFESEDIYEPDDSASGKIQKSKDKNTEDSNSEQPDDCRRTTQSNFEEARILDDFVNSKLCCMVIASLEFINPFINDISKELHDCGVSIEGIRAKEGLGEVLLAVLLYIFNLLESPLSWYEIPAKAEENKNAEEKRCSICNHGTRSIAEKIMDHVVMLRIPFTDLMVYQLDKSFTDEGGESYPGLISRAKAMICYLLFLKYIGASYYPFIFSPEYLVRLCMKPMIELLKRTDAQGVSKGMDLAENMMNRLVEQSFTRQDAERAETLVLFEVLIDIMIFRNDESLRKRALSLLHHTLKRHQSAGRVVLLRELLSKVNHPGASGVLIQCVIKEASTSDLFPASENFSSCSNFIELLEHSLSVIVSEDFDPLFQSDRILASLNLLRFLLLRIDGNTTKIEIFDAFVLLTAKYLEPLRKSINISRINHNVLLREMHQESKSGEHTKKSEENGLEMSVSGFNINQLSYEQKIQQLHIALNTLDIMESLMGRISEILTEKTKQTLSVK